MSEQEMRLPKDTVRYHAMDNLRAMAMIGGIILHASMAYLTMPFKWVVNDSSKSIFFDLLSLFIHSFRMPLFFLIAGFFANFLYQRSTKEKFMLHKVKRIILPFIVAWVIVIPSVYLLTFVGAYVSGTQFASLQEAYNAFVVFMTSGEFLHDNQVMYLWFLFYLTFLYAIQLVLVQIMSKIKDSKIYLFIESINTKLVQSRWKLILLTLTTTAALYLMDFWTIDTPMLLIPQIKFIIFYGIFFLFGWLLYQQKESLSSLKSKAWLTFLVGLLLVLPIYLFIFLNFGINPETQTPVAKLVALFTLALSTWMIVIGITGIFLKYLDKPNRILRYISDSSYWMYLAHFPIICALQIYYLNTPIPPILKFILVCFFTFGILLLSYETLIRYTFVGTLLNGKKERKTSFRGKLGNLIPLKKKM